MKNKRASSVIVAALLLCSLAVFAHAKTLSPQEHLLDLAKAGTFVVNAGSFRVNATLPLGAPLAGYGNRRVKHWPIPEPKEYTTWMQGSEGTMDPNWARAVVIEANGNKICFLTFDGIGADGTINEIAYNIAVGNGFTVPKANCMFSGSHSHSGPGAIASEMLWSLAPATDLVVPSLQRQVAESFAEAMVQAERNMRPAKIGIGASLLYNVTHNRRAGISPYVNSTTIDPNLMVLRVDGDDGKPIATLWNYAIHGTCWGPDNMLFSSDIMGGVNTLIESQTGAYSLFINGDAGDISPDSWVCDGKPNYGGAPTIAQAVLDNRAGIKTSKNVSIQTHSANIDFGPTILNATLARFFNCTTGGPLNVCTLCSILKCVDNAQMPSSWIEDNPVFGAFRVRIDNTQTLFVSMPGEPLVELGNQVRRDSKSLGFDNTFLCGYTNSHMGYFCTPNEYDVGGYESQLTFWGIYTAEKVRSGCFYVASTVRPNDNTLAVTRPPTFLKHLPSELFPEVLKALNLA